MDFVFLEDISGRTVSTCHLQYSMLWIDKVRLWVWDDTKQKIVQKEAVALEISSWSCRLKFTKIFKNHSF